MAKSATNVTAITVHEGINDEICLVFVTGVQSDPFRQFNLVAKELSRGDASLTIKYICWGRDEFVADDVLRVITREIESKKYKKYVLIGLSMGASLVYDALKTRATNVYSVLIGASVDRDDISRTDLYLAARIFSKSKLFNVFTRPFWRKFAWKNDISTYSTEVVENFRESQKVYLSYPLYTWAQEVKYAYEHTATDRISSKIFLVNGRDDTFIRSTNTAKWQALAGDVEVLECDGYHAEIILHHDSYAAVFSRDFTQDKQIEPQTTLMNKRG